MIGEEVERAAREPCARTGAELVEPMVAPLYPGGAGQPARHEGVMRFARLPLNKALRALNTDYRTKRAGDVGMIDPDVTPVARGPSIAGSEVGASWATSTRCCG